MQRILTIQRVLAGMGLAAAFSLAQAAGVSLYLDAAPNVYGSPNYAPWAAAAGQAAADGSFVNMNSSADAGNVGTTGYAAEDATVYSFGDLGKRLTWVYWIPGESVASLTGRIEVKMTYEWADTTYTLYDWQAPGSISDFDSDGDTSADGVLGFAGFAWWGAYGLNTPEALALDLADIALYSGDIDFQVRIADGQGGFEQTGLLATNASVSAVPEPATLALAGLALLGLAASRRRT